MIDNEFIFIPLNTPSSKNSKQWTGKFLVSSKPVQRYIKETKELWIANKDIFHSMTKGSKKPYKIGLYFIRDSRRKFDYINAAQILFDLMVKYEWIDDDNCDEILPLFLGYEVDKQNAGVRIFLIKQ